MVPLLVAVTQCVVACECDHLWASEGTRVRAGHAGCPSVTECAGQRLCMQVACDSPTAKNGQHFLCLSGHRCVLHPVFVLMTVIVVGNVAGFGLELVTY